VADKTIDVVIRARNETDAAFRGAAENVKRFRRDTDSAGKSGGKGGLLGFATETLSGENARGLRMLLRGGAVGVAATAVAEMIKGIGAELKSLSLDLHDSNVGWGEFQMRLVESIPILGSVAKGIVDIGSALTGSAAAAKRESDIFDARVRGYNAVAKAERDLVALRENEFDRRRREAQEEFENNVPLFDMGSADAAAIAEFTAARQIQKGILAEKLARIDREERAARNEPLEKRNDENYRALVKAHEAEQAEAKRNAESLLDMQAELETKRLRLREREYAAEIVEIRRRYERRRAEAKSAEELEYLAELERAEEREAERRDYERQSAKNEEQRRRDEQERRARADENERIREMRERDKEARRKLRVALYQREEGRMGRSGVVDVGEITPWAVGAVGEAQRRAEQDDIALQRELVKWAAAQAETLDAIHTWMERTNIGVVGN
jgi:hypothetical protein